jgi:hypothetical protein
MKSVAHMSAGRVHHETNANRLMNGAEYDDDAFYDEEFYYDAPRPKKGKLMARIAMNTSKLTASQMGTKLEVSLSAIAADSGTFTGATAVLALGNTKLTALTSSEALIESLLVQLETARAERDTNARAAALFYANELATYVGEIAKGSAEIILAAGMNVVRPRSDSPAMTQIEGVKLTAGTDAGTARLKWKPMFRARTYEVELSVDITNPNAWARRDLVTDPLVELQDLTSGQKCWARVRAINNVNIGPWSDAVCCMVP